MGYKVIQGKKDCEEFLENKKYFLVKILKGA